MTVGIFSDDKTPAGTPTTNSRAPTIDTLLTRILEGHKTILDVAEVDGEKRVEFSLQRLPAPVPTTPPRQESSARQHVFFEAASFAAYLLRYGTAADTTCYFDPQAEQAWAVLQERAHGGYEVLSFRPQVHPLWKPWSDLVARGRVTLEAFRDFVNQHRRAVRVPEGKALALMLAQIRAAVEVTIHDGRGRNALNGIVIRSNVQGTDTKELIDLPEEIVLEVPLYVGEPVQRVEMDLVLDASSSGEVTVQIAAGGVQEARVFAFDRMMGTVREALRQIEAVVAYGQPKHVAWAYLPEVKA